jgi:hypothetical protein
VWWLVLIILALGEAEAGGLPSLAYIVRCLEENKAKNERENMPEKVKFKKKKKCLLSSKLL